MKCRCTKTMVSALLIFYWVSMASAQSSQQNSLSVTGEAVGDSSSDVVSKDEENTYKEFFEARAGNPLDVIALGEQFQVQYPRSRYLGGVYDVLTLAYLQAGQPVKMIDAGSKALALNPDDADVLPIMAWAIARQVNSGAGDGGLQLQKAATYARCGLEVLNAMVKPASLDVASFLRVKNDKLSLCHSSLGVVAAKMGRYADAIPELTSALELSRVPDPVDFFVLGFADQQTGRFAAARDAFEKCAASSSPVQSRCQAGIDGVKNNSAATGSQGRR